MAITAEESCVNVAPWKEKPSSEAIALDAPPLVATIRSSVLRP
jgi:hypothetical protein